MSPVRAVEDSPDAARVAMVGAAAAEGAADVAVDGMFEPREKVGGLEVGEPVGPYKLVSTLELVKLVGFGTSLKVLVGVRKKPMSV